MIDKLATIDKKLQTLKEKREQLVTQEALTLLKETKRIFKEEASAGLALTVLRESWSSASETQKQNWRKRGHSFRPSPLQGNSTKTQTPDPTHHQN